MARSSSIDKLPPDILEQLHALLRDPRVNQLDVTARINDLLDERGEEPVSKSAVNRYKMRMDQAGSALRDSRMIAEMWIGKLGAAPQGQVGQLTNEIIRTLALDLSLAIQDLTRDGKIDPENLPETVKMVKHLAEAQDKLEKAASENSKRDAQIRDAARKEAAEAAETAAKKAGVSQDGIAAMRAAIMQELAG